MKQVQNKHIQEVLQYCDDILNGKIKAGIYTKKAIKKFLHDMAHQKEEGFLYTFDIEEGSKIIDFAESLFIPDIQQKLKLLPWMKFVYLNLYGWRLKNDTETRRYRQGFVEVARKNSKTTSLLFPLILYDFLTTWSAEAFFVSADEKQAKKSFVDLVEIISANPKLLELCKITSENIACFQNNSKITFFSADARALDSYKNSVSVLDEFWNYTKDTALQAFKKGGRARKNNLALIITTAGNDVSSPCYAELKKAKSLLNGEFTDETYFSLIYEYDETDDWKDPANFIKANPSLHTIIREDILLNDLNDALITPSHQQDFKSKTCNLWTTAASSWIPLEIIEKQQQTLPDEELLGEVCFAGLDLSETTDWSALSFCFKKNGKYYFRHQFFIPEDTLQQKYKGDNLNIYQWVQDGLVIPTPGAVVDFDFIISAILSAAEKYDLKALVFDPWRSKYIVEKLDGCPFDLIEKKQSLADMAPPTKDYERAMYAGEIIETNPILKWMLSNVQIKPDPNNNYKPLKGPNPNKRIDGVISSLMAFEICSNYKPAVKSDFSWDDVLRTIIS